MNNLRKKYRSLYSRLPLMRSGAPVTLSEGKVSGVGSAGQEARRGTIGQIRRIGFRQPLDAPASDPGRFAQHTDSISAYFRISGLRGSPLAVSLKACLAVPRENPWN